MKRISLFIGEQPLKQVKELAKCENVADAEIIRRAIAEYLKRNQRQKVRS